MMSRADQLLPCDTLRSARLCDSMSSVCLSVTFRYCDHIGRNTSEVISQPNSFWHLITLTINIGDLVQWEHLTPQKLRWSRGGIISKVVDIGVNKIRVE